MLDDILPLVQKPARYVGGEHNSIVKDKSTVDIRVLFCFPDIYEIGMSNLGMRILYDIINKDERAACERAFAPWPDMEALMRRKAISLYGLESGDSARQFDILAFTLQYELSYTTVLNMLNLADLPVYSRDRGEEYPLVIAGGACSFNPEPVADFIDMFAIGDGEDVMVEIIALSRRAKQKNWSRDKLLREAAQIPGIYVPRFYEPRYLPDGRIEAITTSDDVPAVVEKCVVKNLDAAVFPTRPIVPNIEIVHDRVILELFRGCIRGCRFCQAGFIGRPVRTRSADTVAAQGIACTEASGYDEITLSSLSTSDYRELDELCGTLTDYGRSRHIGLSLPSLRADSFSPELLERIQEVRKSGLTFAPEAGSARLRDVINKNLTETDLLRACSMAFREGWSSVKLYFMLGLPTETDDDIRAIAELARKVFFTWREVTPNRDRGVRITVSASCFVPKPHTPFQWACACTPEEFRRKQEVLKAAMRKNITYRWHESATSYIEAVLARGDRRLGAVVKAVWERGVRLEGWGEFFSREIWDECMAEAGLEAQFYAGRERGADEVFPWDMIDCGVAPEYLRSEYEKALAGEPTPDCRESCSGCGANRFMEGGICRA